MTVFPDSHRDLLDAKFATLATIAPDGKPQLTEVWFLAEDETIRLSLSEGRQKMKNLEARPVATMFILDLENPFRFLEVRADVSIAPDEDRSFAERVGAKYHADLSEYDAPGERRVIVTLHPTKVNAADLG
jgi:PPOX class probable F420-dependent enzyme